MKRIVRKALHRLGYDLVRRDSKGSVGIGDLSDLSESERRIVSTAKPFTMTSSARMASLVDSVKFISKNKIKGDIVECGVWRGGSMMIIALMLKALGDESRSLYLYDTYEGMPDPTENDIDYAGVSASEQLANTAKGQGMWCEASIEDVQRNVLSTGYPSQQIHFIKGRVEETIPENLPNRLALLRLDTDWYASTKHELTHLYPILSPSGIVIIDDYGYWQGAKKAVDEYFADGLIYLHRIDNTGRLILKPDGKQNSRGS